MDRGGLAKWSVFLMESCSPPTGDLHYLPNKVNGFVLLRRAQHPHFLCFSCYELVEMSFISAQQSKWPDLRHTIYGCPRLITISITDINKCLSTKQLFCSPNGEFSNIWVTVDEQRADLRAVEEPRCCTPNVTAASNCCFRAIFRCRTATGDPKFSSLSLQERSIQSLQAGDRCASQSVLFFK